MLTVEYAELDSTEKNNLKTSFEETWKMKFFVNFSKNIENFSTLTKSRKCFEEVLQ